MNTIILDTNVVIGYFKGDQTLKPILESADIWFLPVMVVGELFYGAYKSSRKTENLQLYRSFFSQIDMLFPGEKAAEVYGQIKATLRKAGTPIPENDVWIASIAIAADLPLATMDKHFLHVPDLTLAIPLK